MDIEGSAMKNADDKEGTRDSLLPPPFPRLQSNPDRFRISALLSLLSLPFAKAQSGTPDIAPPEGWDDFTNNLGSDLAPLLALFGEQVTKQYLSESLARIDCLLFALAPLGIITAMVSAIRVAGSPLLRSLVGRAKESRGGVEADVMSSTSTDVCELWNGEGVVRVMGRPVILQLVRIDVPSEPDSAGIYTFHEAVSSRLYEPYKGAATAGSQDTRDTEDLRYLDMPPNLSMNISVKPLATWLLRVFIAVGILVQGAVLVYAGLSQYYLKLEKNDHPPEEYGFWVFLAGTISLAAGMFGCAMVVEHSTTETTWVPAQEKAIEGDSERKVDIKWQSVIWIQQGGQTVGDQRFESFARVTKKSNKILTSHKRAKSMDNTNNGSNDDSWDDPAKAGPPSSSLIKRFGTNSIVPAIIITAFIGFISQFLGLRVLHSSVTIAQLGAIIIMTVLRSCAYIQRDKQNDIHEPEQVEGYELDWLAKHLNNCQKWEVIAGPVEGRIDLPDISGDALEVLKSRARLAKLSTEWKLDTRLAVETLKVVIEATMNEIFTTMALIPGSEKKEEFKWRIPVKAKLTKNEVHGRITLTVTRSMGDNSNWRPWRIDQSDLEAVMCLWISSLTRASRRQKIGGGPDLKIARSLEYATDEAKMDYALWINRGSSSFEAELDPNIIYFGWSGSSQNATNLPSGSGDPDTLSRVKYLQVEAEGDMETLCAQSIYTLFLSNVASKLISKVGGATTPRTEQSAPRILDPADDSNWANSCLSNSNFVSLAAIYNDAGLGTIEEAYFSIIPAFHSANKLPFADEAVTSPKCLRQGKWIEVVKQDLWLYRTIEQRISRGGYAMAIAHVIASRLRKITEVLIIECDKVDCDKDLTLQNLWYNSYSLCSVIIVPSLDQAVAIVNLYLTQHKFNVATDPAEVLEATNAIIHRLPPKDYGKIDLISKLMSFKHGSLSRPDELEKYLSRPGSPQLIAKTTIETQIRMDNPGNVPIALRLIRGYRTPLQFASEIGNISIVKSLIQAEADVNANPAEYRGRTALQAAAGAGHLDIVKILLPRANVNAEPATVSGRTALQAAAEGGYSDIVGLLIQAGATISVPCAKTNGLVALNAAAKYGHVEILQSLIELGANVNAPPTGNPPRTALQVAAEHNNPEAVKALQLAGADINAKPAVHRGRTALQAASERGYNEIVELLLGAGADINAKPATYHGRTALQAAAEGGHKETVILLQSANADINAKPAAHHGRTVLQAAAGEGHKEIVKLILIDWAIGTLGRTALQAALQIAAEGGHKEVVQMLLRQDVDVNAQPEEGSNRTPLQSAAEKGHIGIVHQLLTAKANINADASPYDGRTALQAAAENGHKKIVELLQGSAADVNAGPALHNGRTALQGAAQGGHKAIIEILLSNGAEVNAKPAPHNGRTALQGAAQEGHITVVELLVSARAEVNAEPAPHNGRTALQGAAQEGHKEIIEFLLSNKADVNAQPATHNGRTALQAAAGAGRLGTVEYLCSMEAEINAGTRYSGSRTALQAAAEGGYREIVEFLLSKEAEINTMPAPENGLTAVQAAAGSGDLDTTELLVAAGADIMAKAGEKGGRTALQAAAEKGHMKVVEFLLSKGADINASPSPENGRTALQAAAEGGHKDIVELLLEYKANINDKPAPRFGRTAIQAAAHIGHRGIVELLLSNGADVNAEPALENGQAALQAASRGGHIDIVKSLLSAGADLNSKHASDGNLTALEAAVEAGELELVELLLSLGADVNANVDISSCRTALQTAAEGGHTAIVELLLPRTLANTPLALADRGTALTKAAGAGHIEIVKMLLAGLEYHWMIPPSWQETPLDAASSHGQTEIVKLLLENGANPRRETLYQARKNSHKEVVELLRDRIIHQERDDLDLDGVEDNSDVEDEVEDDENVNPDSDVEGVNDYSDAEDDIDVDG